MVISDALPADLLDATPTVAGLRPGTQAARDWEIVAWVGRMGVVTIEHVRTRFDLGRTSAYRRVAACARAGLVERIETLRGQPALIRATRRGLRFAGLALPLVAASPYRLGHQAACLDVALLLEQEFGPTSLRSEREIRAIETASGRPLASAAVENRGDGQQRWHRADLCAIGPAGTVAVEVELTAKGPRRLETIVRAWRRARWVAGIRYYARPGSVSAGIRSAIVATHAQGRVALRALPEAAPPARRSGTAP
jgi:hypothetical protein